MKQLEEQMCALSAAKLVCHLGVDAFCLWLQLVWWEAQWTWRYTIKKQPYNENAQIYLTRNFLRLSADAWDALEPSEREEMLSKELWIKERQKVCRIETIASACQILLCICDQPKRQR